MTPEDLFRRLVDLLEESGIPHMLTGSFASAYYGVPRGTQDIDLVIAATRDQLRSLVARLPRGEYYVDETAALAALDDEGQFNVIDLQTGWKIDFIIRKRRPFSQAEFSRRRAGNVGAVPIAVAAPEDLVIAKLEWAKLGDSRRQIEDASGILGLHASELDWEYLDNWIEKLGLRAQLAAALQSAGIDRSAL